MTTQAFLLPDDVRDLVAEQFGADRELVALDRLTGGTKKGVYRFGTKTVPMPGAMEVKTTGPDNNLRLVITVA